MSDKMTPSTLSAISGITDGTALKVSDTITSAYNRMIDYANVTLTYRDSFGVITGYDNPLHDNLLASASLMTAQATKVKNGLHSYLGQAIGHVAMAKDLKKSTDFMANVKFDDLGSGVKDISSSTDQGLTATVGNLTAAGIVITNVGKVYDVTNISTFGTPGGLVQSLIKNKLANYTGLNAELAKLNVNTSQLADPSYAPQIRLALQSIKDSTILKTVTDQFKLSYTITSLADLLDINKLAGTDINNINGGLTTLTSKLKDLGVSFASTTAAVNMLNSVTVPTVTTLNSSNTSSLSNSISTQAKTLIGTGSGAGGLPTLTDFMGTMAGGNVWISDFIVESAITQTMVDRLNAYITNVSSLFTLAGMDIDTVPSKTLSSVTGFATGLITYGADTEAANIISSVANVSTTGGQAILASLAEGKNRKSMEASGIAPIKYS